MKTELATSHRAQCKKKYEGQKFDLCANQFVKPYSLQTTVTTDTSKKAIG